MNDTNDECEEGYRWVDIGEVLMTGDELFDAYRGWVETCLEGRTTPMRFCYRRKLTNEARP